MSNEIKREIEKIAIPKELHERAEIGIKQVKKERKKRKKYPKWLIGTAASFFILFATYSFDGPYLADATGTLIGKFFGSEVREKVVETYPEEESDIYLPQIEQHLELAKEHLSPEEFEAYGQLVKEMAEIDVTRAKNINGVSSALEERELELQKEMQAYGIFDLTNHTLEEAQAMVSYPIKRPDYIPEGYELAEEEAITEEKHPGERPEVMIKYRQTQGEFGFRTLTEDINVESELKFYENNEFYQLSDYAFEYAYEDDSNVHGMSITIPEEEYRVSIIADILTKEEMEKVLLSMVEE